MNKCCIEEHWIRDWLDDNWLDIVDDYERIVDFPVEEWGGIAAGYIARYFGIKSMSPECVEMITRVVKELDGMEFVYDHELRRNVRVQTKREPVRAYREYGDMMAILRRRKRIQRWIRLPYLVVKHFMITKNLKLAVKLAGLVLR